MLMTASDLTFVLVHSPVVGPFTWALVAKALQEQGIGAIVPDIWTALDQPPPYWRGMAGAVAGALRDGRPKRALVLVGHSGSGPLLPLIRDALDQRVAAYAFVDAGLPSGGTTGFERMPPGLTEYLRTRVKDGWLPPWSQWWGTDALREHLPDDTLRHRFISELRPLPLALFEERLPEISVGTDVPCTYLQLSVVYDAEMEHARKRGWPVSRLDSHHLGMLTEPRAIAKALVDLIAQLPSAATVSTTP